MPSPEHETVANILQESMSLIDSVDLEVQRRTYDDMLGAFPVPEGVALIGDNIEHIPVEWIEPGSPQGTLLYLHGGGYTTGSIVAFRALCAAIALHTRCRVCLIDYRLAPEQPFPAAVDDAILAYRWLLDTKKVNPSSIAVGGDSAGGGLTLATLINVRESQLPLPGCASVFSPWTDLSNSGESMARGNVDDPILTKDSADSLAQLYCPTGMLTDPLVSPLYGDLTGLPPIQIQVGTRESLLDDARRFAAKARRASVEIEYFEGDGLIHVWPLVAPRAPETSAALTRMGSFISRHIR